MTNVKNTLNKFKEYCIDKLSETFTNFQESPGFFIVVIGLFWDTMYHLVKVKGSEYISLQLGIVCFIAYLAMWIGKYIQHRILKEKMDSIDIDLFGRTIDSTKFIGKKSALQILDEYAEECFDRDVLFFAPVKKDDYITQEEERIMIQTLLDSAASNMSYEMRMKLASYFGEDNLHIILARKCMTIVTIFTASHNKAIYHRSNKDEKIEL